MGLEGNVRGVHGRLAHFSTFTDGRLAKRTRRRLLLIGTDRHGLQWSNGAMDGWVVHAYVYGGCVYIIIL